MTSICNVWIFGHMWVFISVATTATAATASTSTVVVPISVRYFLPHDMTHTITHTPQRLRKHFFYISYGYYPEVQR